MSRHQYARHRGVSRKTVQHQIDIGVIRPDANNRIVVAQADESWGRTRRGRTVDPDSDDGRRSATARVAAALGRLRLTKDRYDVKRERYIERADAIRVGGGEADYFIAEMRRWPRRHAPAFAAELGIDVFLARRILTRFVNGLIVEIGDLRAEAIRAAEAA